MNVYSEPLAPIPALTATSPAAPSTVAGPIVDIPSWARELMIIASLTGATGGPLDVYLQVTPDGGTTWFDYAHFPQKAAASALTHHAVSVSRSEQLLTPTAIGSNLTPALAVNTVVGGEFGFKMRMLFVAGALTTAGASQTIRFIAA